jgi:hypothetical protein
VRGQLDEHATGDPAGTVHQDSLPGADPELIADRLVGGERRDRQHRGGIERHPRRQDGSMPGHGDILLGPGALIAQRNRMRGHPVTCLETADLVSDRSDDPGCLHA